MYREPWLLASSRNDGVICFASNQDIQTIFNATDIIMDGTFKVAPHGTLQLYSLHSWGEFGHEAIPSCHSVMEGKGARSYIYLLTEIRQRVQQNHGGIGRMKRFHIDYELAAYAAIRQVLPEVEVKGCSFHFGQALNRKLQSLGLRDVWNDDGAVGEWIGCTKALCLLPESLIPLAFDDILQRPPLVADQQMQLRLGDFSVYFRDTWLNGNFPISMWSHWSNPGPRTTNHAEGYHNLLKITAIREMKLAMRNFLHVLQPLHNKDQVRVRNLRRGMIQPKQRDQIYVDLDSTIYNEKVAFYQATSYLWDFPGFHPFAMQPQDRQHLLTCMHTFLRRARHWVGKKSRVIVHAHL